MSSASVSFASKEEVLYAYLEGEIDHDAAQQLRRAIDGAVVGCRPRSLVMDFGQVGFMDSSGLGLILGRKRSMQAIGGTLAVQHPPAQVAKMLALIQLESVEV